MSFTLVVFFVSLTTAQTKTYTMEEAVLGLRQNLAPETIQQTAWIPNREAFTKLQTSTNNPSLIRVSVPSLKEQELFNLNEINTQLFGNPKLQRLPYIQWLDANSVYFRVSNVLYTGVKTNDAWEFKSWVELPKNTTNLYVNSQEKQVVYSKANNIYLTNSDGKTQAITTEENPEIVSGQIVSRNEFGVNRGVFFAPKGNAIAFYQKDESNVADYPVIDWLTVPAESKTVKYPMAGQDSEQVRLGVYNPDTQETVFMQTGKNTEHYLTNVTWDPEGDYLYIGIFERSQNHLTLNKYDATTGELVRTLFEEHDPKYVHPTAPLSFIPGKDDQFVWWSERDGFQHLYRYTTKGKLLNQITTGDWVVNAIKGWLPKRHEIIITSSKLSAMDRNLYAVNWKNGKIRRLDKVEGMHRAKVSSNGKYWIDQYTNYDTPNKIRVASTKNNWEHVLLDAENPLKAYAKPEIKELTITAADGKTPLNARLILPPNFDASKKYPVVVYLYNGPGVQLLHHSFPESGNLWYNYMAQHGYIIFTMDGRGSSNRGLAFEQATFRQLGTEEMKDQLQGVAYLKSLPYVDSERLGVHGWSFGGFMTTSLMLRYPGVFKVGVAGGPVMDWRMYEVMYTERYMDTPQENPEGYAKANLLDKTGNLEGKLLLIHGAQDDVVVWQHSMRFLHQSIKNNVQVDYFVYPAYPHNVRGKDRIHLMQKITDYFDKFLK